MRRSTLSAENVSEGQNGAGSASRQRRPHHLQRRREVGIRLALSAAGADSRSSHDAPRAALALDGVVLKAE